MRYRRHSVEIRYDDGAVRRAEVLSRGSEIRLFAGREEVLPLPVGTPKSVYLEGATGPVAEGEYVFELDGKYLTVRPNGTLRPMVTGIDGLARFTFGKNELITVIVIGALFLGLITLVILL